MKRFLFIFSISILLFSCGGDKSDSPTYQKATGQLPDTSDIIMAYPLNGVLRVSGGWLIEKDTTDWTDTDTTTKKKMFRRGQYFFPDIALPDSIFDEQTKKAIKPKLDSLGQQVYRHFTPLVHDSLVYFWANIEKIKKEKNLK